MRIPGHLQESRVFLRRHTGQERITGNPIRTLAEDFPAIDFDDERFTVGIMDLEKTYSADAKLHLSLVNHFSFRVNHGKHPAVQRLFPLAAWPPEMRGEGTSTCRLTDAPRTVTSRSTCQPWHRQQRDEV